MDKLISALDKKFKNFEIWREVREVLTLEESNDGVRKEFNSKEEVAVRVFEKGKIGFAYLSSVEDIDSLVANLKLSLSFAEYDRDIELPEPDFEKLSEFGEEEEISVEKLQEKNLEIKELAKSKPFLKSIERISSNCEKKRVFFYNSSKGVKTQLITKYASGIVLIVKKNGDEKMEWDFGIAKKPGNLNTSQIVENAYERATKLLNSSPTYTGEYIFLFEPRASSDFLEVFGQSFIGENVFKNRSLISSDSSFSDKVSIYDDPFIEQGSINYFFDGEGFTAKRKCLLEKGKVKNYLYDSFYGKKMGANSNGSSIRNKVSLPPKNWYSNIILEKGNDNIGEFLKGRKVIGIVSLLGMHLVNPVTGDFSVGFEGYILEDGNYVKALSGVSVSGNLKHFYQNIIAVGNDLFIYGQSGSPTILVGPLVLSGI